MKQKLFFLVLLSWASVAQAQTFSSSGAIAVRDGIGPVDPCSPDTPTLSVIPVTFSNPFYKIIDPDQVTINLNMSHTFSGDLLVELVAPDLSSCILINRLGRVGICSDYGSPSYLNAFNTLSFNASYTALIPNAVTPVPAGSYSPTGSTGYPSVGNLSSFLLNKLVEGNWSIRVTDFSATDIGTIDSWNIVFGSTALPLNLLSFTGSKSSNGYNEFEWKTGVEKQTASFDLERSNNGSQYTAVASVIAIGNGNNTYIKKDIYTLVGDAYYRLKMIDQDGKYRYSNTIRLSNSDAVKQYARISPNPAKSNITLWTGNDISLIGTEAKLVDAMGKAIASIEIKETEQNINLAPFSSGMYTLRLANGETIKINKQD